MNPFWGTYRGCRVLVTGHTGFKGGWLAHWLSRMGAHVTGIGLDPRRADGLLVHNLAGADLRFDIGDAPRLAAAIAEAKPEIVFHLAAQPLVRLSYAAPLETWQTNVMGTANVLEACRKCDSVRAILSITTDKVYANQEWVWGYRETDALGGHDPYSASKAACEILIASYRKSFFYGTSPVFLASARAGNVIGGGDWSIDRLIPDVMQAMQQGKRVTIRSPHSTRPWQHVLDCLSGYLLLGHHLLKTRTTDYTTAWNFGPNHDDNRSVLEVLTTMSRHWPEIAWDIAQVPQVHEARLLHLDSSKSRTVLGWKPVWRLETALQQTVEWYRAYAESGEVRTDAQLCKYLQDAAASGQPWA